MKTVYIVRHAKSSWDITDIPDEKRPLLEKGKKRTKKAIDFLLEQKIKVDYILSSHAVRALETARILAHALKYKEENIKIDSHLYYTDGDNLSDQFFDLPDRFESIMIVGHNPALSDYVNQYLPEPIDHLPTSGIVSISFDTDRWEKVPLAKHKVNFVLFPKELEKKDNA
jgi:phosphohistidine phosphatase